MKGDNCKQKIKKRQRSWTLPVDYMKNRQKHLSIKPKTMKLERNMMGEKRLGQWIW